MGKCAATAGRCEAMRDGDTLVLSATGAWTLHWAGGLDAALRRLATGGVRVVHLDLGGLEALDTAGAWLLERTRLTLARAGIEVQVGGAAPEHAHLLERVAEAGAPPPLRSTRHVSVLDIVARIGAAVIYAGHLAREITGFLGATLLAAARVLAHPRRRMRFTSFVARSSRPASTPCPSSALLSLPDRRRARLPGRRSAAPLRRRDLHRRSGRHRHVAARWACLHHRHHRRRPLGQRLHRADRHHAGQRGSRRDARRSGSTRSNCWCCRACSALIIALPLLDLLGRHDWACWAARLMHVSDLDITIPRSSCASCASAVDRDALLDRHDQGAGVRLHHRAGRLLRRAAGERQRRKRRASSPRGRWSNRSSW